MEGMTPLGIVQPTAHTLMDEKKNQIIDFIITHVSNAGNSQTMEKYGLQFVGEAEGLEH